MCVQCRCLRAVIAYFVQFDKMRLNEKSALVNETTPPVELASACGRSQIAGHLFRAILSMQFAAKATRAVQVRQI